MRQHAAGLVREAARAWAKKWFFEEFRERAAAAADDAGTPLKSLFAPQDGSPH
jgi:hypothetical protein